MTHWPPLAVAMLMCASPSKESHRSTLVAAARAMPPPCSPPCVLARAATSYCLPGTPPAHFDRRPRLPHHHSPPTPTSEATPALSFVLSAKWAPLVKFLSRTGNKPGGSLQCMTHGANSSLFFTFRILISHAADMWTPPVSHSEISVILNPQVYSLEYSPLIFSIFPFRQTSRSSFPIDLILLPKFIVYPSVLIL